MNCPVCGLEPLSNQKFCRSCGTSLGTGTLPLADIVRVSSPESEPAIALKAETQLRNKMVRLGFIIMFAGVVPGVIGKMLIHSDFVTVVGVLLSVAGMFMVAYPFLLPSPRRKSESVPPLQSEALTPVEPTKKLPQMSADYIPSVVEGTTELLKEPAAMPADPTN